MTNSNRKHILWVDDDLIMLHSELQLLEMLGHSVTATTSITEAFSILSDESNQVDLILLDLMMSPEDLLGDKETHGGLLTGLYFLDLLASKKLLRDDQKIYLISHRHLSAVETEKVKSLGASFIAKSDLLRPRGLNRIGGLYGEAS